VASAFEFAEVCRKHDYHNFVFSMKASNPLVMVQVGVVLGSGTLGNASDFFVFGSFA